MRVRRHVLNRRGDSAWFNDAERGARLGYEEWQATRADSIPVGRLAARVYQLSHCQPPRKKLFASLAGIVRQRAWVYQREIQPLVVLPVSSCCTYRAYRSFLGRRFEIGFERVNNGLDERLVEATLPPNDRRVLRRRYCPR